MGIPQPVRQAYLEAADDLVHYPDPEAGELRQALAAQARIPAEWIICGNGCGDLIFSLAAAKKPKRAIVPAPTFAEYEQALTWAGCEVLHLPLVRAEGFRLKAAALVALIEDENTRQPVDMLFLCNPNNPTGLALGKEEMRQVAAACKTAGIFLVVDECFGEFLEDWQEHTMQEELTGNRDLMILKAFTKTYALAGLRLGYAFCSDEKLLAEMVYGRQPWSVSLPAQRAGLAALSVHGFLAATRRFLKAERTWLRQELIKLGYPVYPSEANYLFFENPDEDRRSLFEWCKDRGILIRDCSNYCGLRKGDYRISVRTRSENEVLLEVFRSYQSAV